MISFFLLHNTQRVQSRSRSINPAPKSHQSPSQSHRPLDNFWTPAMCVAADVSCSGLFACNSVKSCACIQVIPPAQAFDMKNAFYWDYFYNVSDLRVSAPQSQLNRASLKRSPPRVLKMQIQLILHLCLVRGASAGAWSLPSNLQSIFAHFNSISQFHG